MRVLMTADTVGGVWTYSTVLTGELLRQGVSVALVSIGRHPSPEQLRWLRNTSAEWGKSFRWEISEASLEWMSNNEQAFCEPASLLLQVARDFQADLLHSNQFCFGALPLSMPSLVVAHSDVLSWATACRGKALDSCPWLATYTRLLTTGLQSASAVVAPTQWMLNALRNNFDFTGQFQVIANGRTLKAPPLRSGRKLQAVSSGRLWDEAKNLAVLRGLHATVPILVAGEVQYESQTARWVAEIEMLGQLEQDALLTLFRESAIYLCTSVYEPFGLAPLEAALCGCAVIAHDIPSLREVWGDGALYFHDPSSLQACLSALAHDPLQLADAQRRSNSRAQKYPAVNMANQYLELYRAMLSKYETSAHVA